SLLVPRQRFVNGGKASSPVIAVANRPASIGASGHPPIAVIAEARSPRRPGCRQQLPTIVVGEQIRATRSRRGGEPPRQVVPEAARGGGRLCTASRLPAKVSGRVVGVGDAHATGGKPRLCPPKLIIGGGEGTVGRVWIRRRRWLDPGFGQTPGIERGY